MAEEEKKQLEEKTETSKQEAEKSEPEAKTTEAKGKDVKVPAKFKKLVEEIEGLSVLELSELVKVLEDKLGVSAAAPMAVAAAPAAGAAEGGEAAEEKAEFNVVLKDAGAQKINVIKAVREVSGLGLAESKEIADNAPKTVLEKAKKEDAEAAKTKLEEAGATVELE